MTDTSRSVKDAVTETLEGYGITKEKFANQSDLAELISIKSLLLLSKDQLESFSKEINSAHIPSAREELDEIVKSSDQSMESFLDCASELDNIEKLDQESLDKVRDIATKMYEASVSHDLIIQRISKIVNILTIIESDIGDMLALDETNIKEITEKKSNRNNKDELMNGPQSAEDATDQGDIDALFN